MFRDNFGGAFENMSKNSRQCPLQLSGLLVFLLVSGTKSLRRKFRFSERGN
jgi:hypothetical protein